MLQIFNRYQHCYYRELGRTPPSLDCWGLVRLAYKDLYGKYPDLTKMVEAETAQAGDIILANPDSVASHSAIVLAIYSQPMIMDISGAGVILRSLQDFMRQYPNIKIFRNKQ